jgi:hypothetical protein
MAKYLSKGFKISAGGVNIGQLTKIGELVLTAEELESTTLEDLFKTVEGGLRDGGDVAMEGFFDPSEAGQLAMRNKIGTIETFVVDFPPAMGGQWIFDGLIKEFGTNGELNTLVPFKATVKVSGEPTITFVSSNNLTGLSLSGTGGALSPAFAGSNYSYTFTGVSASSVTVTATLAGASLKLYVDDVYLQDLTSGSPSSAIPLTINAGKKIKVLARESGKTQKAYEVIAVKTA